MVSCVRSEDHSWMTVCRARTDRKVTEVTGVLTVDPEFQDIAVKRVDREDLEQPVTPVERDLTAVLDQKEKLAYRVCIAAFSKCRIQLLK